MKAITQLLFVIASMSLSSYAIALESDRDQPAHIEADDIEFDFKNGTRIYNNNVLVVQGTLRLKADKLVGVYSGDELDKATAWGSLARFKQRPDGKQDDVEGWAKKIVVNQKENTLTLLGKAALKQGPDTARGETIVYNMATDTLKVQGGAKVGAGGKDGTTPPKRQIEDPFKDNKQGPPPAAIKKKPVSKTAAKDGDTEKLEELDDLEEEIEEQVEEAEPVHSGRSRLIIQPK